MTASSRREQTKIQNRETILAAARQVFAQLGFAAATVRDIIRATPLASGTFYNYFKSKEEVYQALRDEVALKVRPRLRDARRTAASREEFLAASFRAFFAFVAENRGETPQVPERFRMDSPEVLEGFAELREDISAAVARGFLPATDVGELSAALTGVAFELAERVKAGADVEATTQFATRLFLGGLAALEKPRTA
ncbi:MAG TPA: helix-turn-helix domain-containing protein [Rhizomicrobium sp.]|jgi:AcrR family transcriptional regulator|nr:helix-turn-helix domain-containing protein [Rhizomicrobium sp.]